MLGIDQALPNSLDQFVRCRFMFTQLTPLLDPVQIVDRLNICPLIEDIRVPLDERVVTDLKQARRIDGKSTLYGAKAND